MHGSIRRVMLMFTKSQNLPGMLEQAAAVFRDAAGQLPPASRQELAQRARHFAWAVRFGLDEPGAMRRLHQATGGLLNVSSLRRLLPRVLDGALWLMAADFGNIQLLDPVTGSLRIVTQYGFGPEFVDYFAVVDDGHAACGRAAKECAQTVIADVAADLDFAPHRDIAAACGFRAVQSTPLADYAGHLVGVVSTHFRRPHRPSGTDLQVMELYADYAGEALARHLSAPAGRDPGDPVGRAMLWALLGPGTGQAPAAAARTGPGDGTGASQRRPADQPASPDETMSRFAGDIVHRLFSIGLSLDGARGIATDGPGGDRLAAVTGELDRLIRDIRAIVFGPADHQPQPPPGPGLDRWSLPPG
jgi:GAF domain-containing protein